MFIFVAQAGRSVTEERLGIYIVMFPASIPVAVPPNNEAGPLTHSWFPRDRMSSFMHSPIAFGSLSAQMQSPAV